MEKKLKMLNIKFYSEPIYDGKYLKIKLKTFNDVVNTVFSDDKTLKESIHYIGIAAITIDSVIKLNNKSIFGLI